MTGACLPFRWSGPTGSVCAVGPAASFVVGPMRISPGWACCSSRAATFTVSPDTRAWLSPMSRPVTAGPVFTPIRTRSRTRSADSSSALSPATASRMPSAAANARRASSSCIVGTPKTAMTASPMNFSTVPPNSSICSRVWAKYRSVTVRRVSGSSVSDSTVESTRSQKTTVTSLRSAVDGADAATWRGVPQCGQKRASGGRPRAQDAQFPAGSGVFKRALRRRSRCVPGRRGPPRRAGP